MKNWKVVQSTTTKIYYSTSTKNIYYEPLHFVLIKDSLIENEAISFSKTLNKLRR